tara:strand:+ start:72 stop:293 length:222 start_codon:yes stop_codon:yes gene_type:complete
LIPENRVENMSKILEMIGLVLVSIMILGFVGALDTLIPLGIENGLTPLFWGCAGGTLIIILYRKRKRKQAGLE